MFTPVKPCIIIDTREQQPYTFERFLPQIESIERSTLKSGDYSLKGKQTNIQLERKSLPDLVNTVIHGRDRFKAELARLHVADFSAVLIEATMQQVCSPYSFSKANPASVIGSIEAFSITYGVHFFFCGDRATAEARAFGLLNKFWRASHGA